MSRALKELDVLLVEDDAKLLASLHRAFEDIFNNVYDAQNGLEGVKKFKKFNPNLVITDILMPIEDGLAMIRQIKQIFPHAPIFVLSGFSQQSQLQGVIDIGVEHYFFKPVDVFEFASKVGELMKAKLNSDAVVTLGAGYTFDKLRRILLRDGEPIALTKKELSFVSLLITRVGEPVLYDEIKRYVWAEGGVSDVALRTFVKRIRDKIGEQVIRNVPSLGYMIDLI